MTTDANDAGDAIRALLFALVALACGHMLSTLLRTIPAVSLDLMAADFHIMPDFSCRASLSETSQPAVVVISTVARWLQPPSDPPDTVTR